VVSVGGVVLYNVATTTYSLAWNAVSLGGQLLQNGVVATGNSLYPHLISFMENIIDGDNVPRIIQAVEGPTMLQVDNEAKDNKDVTPDVIFTDSTVIQHQDNVTVSLDSELKVDDSSKEESSSAV
jgi:hypothetical protein